MVFAIYMIRSLTALWLKSIPLKISTYCLLNIHLHVCESSSSRRSDKISDGYTAKKNGYASIHCLFPIYWCCRSVWALVASCAFLRFWLTCIITLPPIITAVKQIYIIGVVLSLEIYCHWYSASYLIYLTFPRVI